MSYDQKCYDLAKVFLADEPALDSEESRKTMAQDIQNAIEDWIWEKQHHESFDKARPPQRRRT